MDRELGVEEGQPGPVTRRLQEVGPVIPLVFGGFGEVSEEVHNLVGTLSLLRFAKEGRAAGREGSEGRLGVIKGQVRRWLSLATVRANTTCMLALVSQVGEGAGEAGKRRRWLRYEEENMRRGREAIWRAEVSGRGVVRRGRFWLP